MRSFSFVREDYEDDHDPIDEIKSRDEFTVSDSMEIEDNTKYVHDQLTQIDDGIQTAQMLNEFKTVFDDEYNTPKEVEVAVVTAVESLVEIINYKTPGIAAVKANAPGYKNSYSRFITISKENIFASIGKFLSNIITSILNMFKKFFAWITGSGDKSSSNEKADEKHKKTEEKQEKSKELVDELMKNKDNEEKVKEIIEHINGGESDVIKQLAADDKAANILAEKLEAATKYIQTYGVDVLPGKLLSEGEIDIEDLIVKTDYIKVAQLMLTPNEQELREETKEYTVEMKNDMNKLDLNKFLNSAEDDEKKYEGYIRRRYITNKSSIEGMAQMFDKPIEEKFGSTNINIELKLQHEEETPFGKQELYILNIEKLKINENMKITCKSPEPSAYAVNDRKRYNDKINEFMKYCNELKENMIKFTTEFVKEAEANLKRFQGEIDGVNMEEINNSPIKKMVFNFYKCEMINGNALFKFNFTNIHYLNQLIHFVGTICLDVLNASDDYEDLHAVPIVI